jgi:ribonucleotide reductase alpha subunit
VYDANLNRYKHRKEKYALAKKMKADVKLLWVYVPRDLAKKRRLAAQHDGLVPKTETPHDMFERIADIFEPPKKKELFVPLDGTKISADYVAAQLGLEVQQDA